METETSNPTPEGTQCLHRSWALSKATGQTLSNYPSHHGGLDSRKNRMPLHLSTKCGDYPCLCLFTQPGSPFSLVAEAVPGLERVGHIYSNCSSGRIGWTVTRYSGVVVKKMNDRLTSEKPGCLPGLSLHICNMGQKGPVAGELTQWVSRASLEHGRSRNGKGGWR